MYAFLNGVESEHNCDFSVLVDNVLALTSIDDFSTLISLKYPISIKFEESYFLKVEIPLKEVQVVIYEAISEANKNGGYSNVYLSELFSDNT